MSSVVKNLSSLAEVRKLRKGSVDYLAALDIPYNYWTRHHILLEDSGREARNYEVLKDFVNEKIDDIRIFLLRKEIVVRLKNGIEYCANLDNLHKTKEKIKKHDNYNL